MGGKSSRLVVNTKPTARCGTRLKGIVQLDITKPLKVENLHCRFVGRAKSAWNEGPLLKTGDHKVLSHSYHYSKFPAVLDPGVHEFPFAFNVPEGLPPSAHQSFGSVEYMVEAGYVPLGLSQHRNCFSSCDSFSLFTGFSQKETVTGHGKDTRSPCFLPPQNQLNCCPHETDR